MACRKCQGEVDALNEQIQYLRKQVEEKDMLLAARPIGESAFSTFAAIKELTAENGDEIDPEEIEGAMPISGVNRWLRYLHGDALSGIPVARGGPFAATED
jgi:hypothetical protein